MAAQQQMAPQQEHEALERKLRPLYGAWGRCGAHMHLVALPRAAAAPSRLHCAPPASATHLHYCTCLQTPWTQGTGRQVAPRGQRAGRGGRGRGSACEPVRWRAGRRLPAYGVQAPAPTCAGTRTPAPAYLQGALKLADAALKKHKNNQLVRALKSFALIKSGKAAEALQVGRGRLRLSTSCRPAGRLRLGTSCRPAGWHGLHVLHRAPAVCGLQQVSRDPLARHAASPPTHHCSRHPTPPRPLPDLRRAGGGGARGGAGPEHHGVHLQGRQPAR